MSDEPQTTFFSLISPVNQLADEVNFLLDHTNAGVAHLDVPQQVLDNLTSVLAFVQDYVDRKSAE